MKALKIQLLGLFLFGFISMFHLNMQAQTPSILSVSEKSGSFGNVVTIVGSGFGTNAATIKVVFGATVASISSISDDVLEVQVPAGTTYDRISVTNIVTGLTGYSSEQFYLSFGGNNGISNLNFDTQQDFGAETGLYDLCMCDFNNDGKPEIVTANQNSGLLSIFRNNSTPESIALFKAPLALGRNSLNVNCGDLNGDGKPELVITEDGSSGEIHIYQNTSVGLATSFSVAPKVIIPGATARRVVINDIDKDGKPELIITNSANNTITIVRNISNVSQVLFSPSFTTLTMPGAASSFGLAVEDLNSDGLPDVVATQFLTDNGNLFLFDNQSTPGNFAFSNAKQIVVEGTMVHLKVGDIDGDSKPDVVATHFLNSTLTVLLNSTVGTGSVTFDTPQSFPVSNRSWGVDLGDLDGDGVKDIIVGSIGDQNSITVLNNNSTPGNLLFNRVEIPTTYINRNVKVGDVDGDAKPDLVFTSIDDVNNGVPSSDLSILRNRHCFVPKIENESPFTICSNTSSELTSIDNPAATYSWVRNAGAPNVTGDPFFDTGSLAGNYTVTANTEGGSCNTISPVVVVSVDGGSAPIGITTGANLPICIGETLNLSASNVAGGSYLWKGPNGYSSTLQNPSIANFAINQIGQYKVKVTVGNCTSDEYDVVVDAAEATSHFVVNSGSDVLCGGGTTQLSVAADTDYSYVWKRNGSIISGATAANYTVNQAGAYSVEVTDAGNASCPVTETSAIDIDVLTAPSANFVNPGTVCAGDLVTFVNNSTTDGSAIVSYVWTFGDGNSSTSINPTHTYASGGSYQVRLVVSYGLGCTDEIIQSVSITGNTLVEIEPEDGQTGICDGESINIGLTETYSSIIWSTGSNSSSITTDQPGIYTVDVITPDGCPNQGTFEVVRHPEPTVEILADRSIIKEGESLELGVSGLVEYTWTATDSISDVTALNPIVYPAENAVYTAVGIDENGCNGEGSISIEVQEGKITDKLNPHRLFSPNNDNIDDFWIVDEILNYPTCNISLFDQQGIKIFESMPYANTWDATSNGVPLPQGVYYYVIVCGENDDRKAGSITVVR